MKSTKFSLKKKTLKRINTLHLITFFLFNDNNKSMLWELQLLPTLNVSELLPVLTSVLVYITVLYWAFEHFPFITNRTSRFEGIAETLTLKNCTGFFFNQNSLWGVQHSLKWNSEFSLFHESNVEFSVDGKYFWSMREVTGRLL